MINIIIDIENPAPLFLQIIEQIKDAISKDKLKSGAALPSIRQLANDLQLNNKTVAKAYRLLERDSVIQTKGYRGTFIHPDAKENCNVDLNKWTFQKISEIITELKDAGVTDSEIRIAFNDAINKRGK